MQEQVPATRILLVEDESGHAELICRAFEEAAESYDVTVASTIAEARQQVTRHLPDLALVDYRLPDGQGDAMLALGKDSFPIVMLTSHGDEFLAVQAIKAGAVDYVAKSPGMFASLPHVVESALREWHLLRERAETLGALRKAEEYFRSTFEQAAVGIIQTDLLGKFVLVNRKFCDIVGYTATELLQITSRDITDDQDHERDEQFVRKLMSGEMETFSIEKRFRRKDGSLVWVNHTVSLMRDAGETARHCVGVVEDISQRKQAEESLRESEGQFRALFESASDGILYISMTTDIVNMNESFARMHGYTIDEMRTMTLQDLDVEDLSHIVPERMHRITNGENLQFEVKHFHKDGHIIDLEVSTCMIVLKEESHVVAFHRDITERKRAEESVRRSETYLKGILDSTGDGILAVGADGKIISANHRFYDMWHIPESIARQYDDAALLAAVIAQLDQPEVFLSKVRELYGSNRLSDDVLHFKDGRVFERHSRPLTLGETLVGRVWSFRDVTDRKKAEDSLRESEARYRTIVGNIGEGIGFVNSEERFIFANRAAEEIFGVESGGLAGMALEQFVSPEQYVLVEKETASRIQGSRSVYELEIARPDGQKRRIVVTAVPQNDEEGGFVGTLGVFRDISKARQAEDEIRLLAHAAASIRDCVTITDLDDKIIFVNDAFLRTYQYAREELVGHPISIVRSAMTSEQTGNQIHEATSAGGWHAELLNRRKDGSEFFVELWTSQVKDDTGKVVALVGVARDITERKRAEEALRHAQKLESIGTLAGGIAHDFNNLLNAIMGQSSLALQKLAPSSPAAAHVTKSVRAAERAADLTRQLLAYSGRGKFVTEEIELNRLVEENAQLLEVSVPKTAIVLCHPADQPLSIRGDTGQIQQVIMNLIINAGEAMGTKPGTISVSTSKILISDKDFDFWKYTNVPLPHGDYALVKVTDTGCGMTEESLARIFDPFFTTKFTGRGLGLAAVLGIIRGHQGGIRIKSEEGRGTEFEIVFPLVGTDAVTKVRATQSVQAMEGKGRTILVIDDEPFVLELVTDIFTGANFTVIGSLNPLEGIELYRQHHDHIMAVILDYSMPGMDGKATFEELLKIDNDVKVFLCSGYTEEEMESAFVDVRPAGFIHKPYQPSALLERISHVLSEGKQKP